MNADRPIRHWLVVWGLISLVAAPAGLLADGGDEKVVITFEIENRLVTGVPVPP